MTAGDVRDDIAAILDLTAQMPAEAMVRGIRSEATMLAGPASDVDRWRARAMSAFWGHIDAAWLDDCRDESHPAWVLGTWDREVCLHYGHERTREATIGSAAAYVSAHLTDLERDAGFAFEELANDVARCRHHLERVLHDHDPTEYGVPCPTCPDGPDLVKTYAEDHDDVDAWTCPRCGQWWTDDDYRKRVGAGYLLYADRLPAADIERAHHVLAGTVRQWALRGHVHKRGRDDSGRLLYDVADVIRQRDRTDEEPNDETV